MKTGKRVSIVVIISLFLAIYSSTTYATMILSFDSSDQSWVGQGQSFTVTPDDGYIFDGSVGYNNHLYFRIFSLNSPFGPDFVPNSGEYHWWILSLAAPYGQVLEVGHYDDTARFPFQDPSQPGLTFSGDHRGNNRNGGFFDIFEISLDPFNNIESLAVDFTQYGEQNEDWWINGKLRFNSDISLDYAPVPEPSTFILLALGFCIFVITKRNKSNLTN